MSGPKSSRYSMTLRQRQMLQEQLRRAREAQILEERKRTEIDVIHHNCSQLRSSVTELQELIAQSDRFSQEGHDGNIDITSLRAFFKEVLTEVEKAEELGTSKGLEQLSAESKKISSLVRKIHSERHKTEIALGQQESSFRDENMKIISSGFELSFANISDGEALKENVFLKRILEELDKLTDMSIPDDLMVKFDVLRRKADEIKSMDYLENFYSISIVPFIKECRERDKLEKQYGEDYRVLRLRYEYLAKELNREIEEIPFSANAVSILLDRIATLEAEELKTKEEFYICQCIEEAMAEMNYSVIGNRDVTKKNGKKFKNVLYKFDEGTAVNVTYSSDGQITMELGGVSDEDRMPTDAESASLEEDMRSFCDDFYEIERKLRARGIEPKHISHLPPDVQFAQIINVSDFEMVEDIGYYEAKKGKRRSGSTGVTLHKEG